MSEIQQLLLQGNTLYPCIPSNEEIKFTAMGSISSPDAIDDEDNDDIDENTRAPVILVAVVDKSGSMGGDKIKSLRDTLQFIIKEMSKKDRLAIVEYDTNVKTTLPLTFMDDTGKSNASSIASKIRTGSSTNMSGGLSAGLKLIPSEVDSNTVVSTLLMTDGHANHGITSTQGIIKQMRDIQQSGLGRCTVNTFGFGSDHNATMLKDISDAAEGMYYFIENADAIASSFADCLGGLLSVHAQGIELTIEACGNNKLGRIHTPKPITTVTDGKLYRIALGDLQEGENRDIPFEITIPSSSVCDNLEVAKISISYFNMKSEEMVDTSQTISISCKSKDSMTDDDKQINIEVNRHCNRVLAADAAENAVQFANKGNMEEARKVLDEAMATIKSSPSANEEMSKGLIEQLQTSRSGLVDRQRYQSQGQYQMNKFSKAMKMQRCAAPSMNESEQLSSLSFETSARKKMKRKVAKR